MTKTRSSPRLILCVLSLFVSGILPAQQTQQLLFNGLRSAASQGQFNAVQSAPNGDLYLLLDQKDGVRLLKTDANATTVLAQAQLGAKGDIGLAMALDPGGNLYVTGTTASGTLAATSGAAFPAPADASTNSFIAKFDANLNPIFVTLTGSGRTAASAIAATADAVFITGSIFGATLPVTPTAFIQTPASNTTQNGFVEKFNATGTTLLYATYLSGANGTTAPTAIAADASDDAYIAGYITSSGYPTLNALVPEMIGTSSGFLSKLTPAGDGIAFSTYIPGSGITSLALDPTAQNLLLSGTIALGQFPVATVATPLVNLPYQTLLRIPLDGSAVLSSTLLAPGMQSVVTPAPNGEAWAAGVLTTPLLPLPTLSTIGNSFALRVTAQNIIDQTLRFGGLPTTNPNYASAPVTLTSLATDASGQPVFAGAVTPTASSSLLATQTYDLPLYNSPTAALPSTIRNAVLAPGSCNGSLCAGSAAYLTKVDPATAAPSLALSADDSPNLTLRNLGSAAATNLQLAATGFTLATNCSTTLAPGSECNIALNGSGPGTITAQADNATTQTATLPAATTTPNAIVFSPKELDFGIESASSPAATRTVTVSNLGTQSQTFASSATGSGFTEESSDCPTNGTAKLLSAGATCHITIAFTASGDPASDGPVQSNWTVGTGSVLLTGYSEAAALDPSASEIDFGTQYTGGLRLPRYLYLSNNSATTIPHTAVSLPGISPFTLIDRCPTQLLAHTVCQIQLNYLSAISPSNDSITLSLDQGLTVLVTGKTLPPPGAGGATVNPNLTVSPSSLNFPNAIPVTAVSSATQTVTIGNTGAQPLPLALSLSGDFTQATSCTSTLAAHSTCTVVISFAPSQPGTRQGLLSVTAGAATTPAYVALSGTATSILSTNNGTLDFGNVIADKPAVQWYKITQSFTTLSVATSNSAFKAILVEDIGYGHGTPPTSAFRTDASASCANCWLGLQFTPPTTGPETATVALRSSVAGNAYALALTGNGLPLTGLILTPVNNDFGAIPADSTSAPTLFTLTNLTSAAVSLTTPTTSAGFVINTTPTGGAPCTATLAPTASCFVQVAFAPTNTGQITGVVTLPTSANTLTASLSGFGAPDPGLSLTPNALTFNNVPGATATQQTIILKNTGTATLQIAAPTVTTTNFTLTTACGTLPPAATCAIAVTYLPGNAPAADTLTIPVISSLTGAAIYTVPLTGAYTTEDSSLQISPAETNFGPQLTGNLGLTRQFTINNLTTKSLTLALSLPRQFVAADPPCAALAPNASCNFSVTFLPLTNGDITGTLFAAATPTDGTATLNSLGYVEGYGLGTGTLAITGNLTPTGGDGTLLNFGQVASGQTLSQTLTLTNPNTTSIAIHRVTSEWPFLSTTTCGATLASGESCAVTVTYSPLNQTATGTSSPLSNTDTGSLVIESDALTSPDIVDLTGTAAPILVAVPDNTAPLAAYTASQSSLTFASTAVGDISAAQTVTLSNTGTLTLHVTGLQTSSDFTTTSTCTTLVPGASCTLTVTFTPQLPSTRISALEISSDASTALDFISLLGTATPASLSFFPASLDFGSLLVGSTSTLPVQVTNTSAAPAVFHGITATGDYTVAGDCPTSGSSLAPNTSCVLEATFTPTQTGVRAGAIHVASSLSTLPLAIALTGIGTQSHLQANPASLEFGSLSLAASAELTLTLNNSGNAPVTGLHLAVTGDYAIITPCALTTLAAGASCSVTVSFTPTALGSRTGTLTASSSSNSPTTLPLTGTGVPSGSFLLTVNGKPSSSVTVKSGYPAAYTLTVTPQNSFSGDVILNCSAITPGQYASCALLPSSIALSGAAQNTTATLNTITSQATLAQTAHHGGILLCLFPIALIFFWRTRPPHFKLCTLILAAAAMLTLNGCGSGGSLDSTDPSLRKTPPGTYQYQITATSTNGPRITQTATLNLIVQ
ncbi:MULTISPECIES: choice-of-anchor D domain-containing protein [Acidobacteriaceae]|uniref:choice-of-anchor D domain-containing protein n=1 Tax=Acidobacteriaceae TaxID=204434 RepID=UPI0020B107F8|nr:MULTISPECIES: choice-of-anchor D domain-containing protein [Acidobacteriaceae]MDW5266609.1 choice-of-anchor D domain-containing protein [Edaphobacter sp.]